MYDINCCMTINYDIQLTFNIQLTFSYMALILIKYRPIRLRLDFTSEI